MGPFEISGDVGAQKPVGEVRFLGRVGLIEASWLGSLWSRSRCQDGPDGGPVWW